MSVECKSCIQAQHKSNFQATIVTLETASQKADSTGEKNLIGECQCQTTKGRFHYNTGNVLLFLDFK